jgi:hypothetical protein
MHIRRERQWVDIAGLLHRSEPAPFTALLFDGTDKIELDVDGNLVLHTPGGRIIQHAPIIYQMAGGQRHQISGGYVLDGEQLAEGPNARPDEETSDRTSRITHHQPIHNRTVKFEVNQYDQARPLIIDPVLSYTYYLGGNKLEYASGIAVDSNGNTYVAGYTFSANFPTVNPLQPDRGAEFDNDPDVFVAKLNPGGSELIYATYLGGSSGQLATGIAIDPSGSAYVCGISSTNFPVVNALQPMPGDGIDAFVAKLNPAGSALVYSTFLGGSGVDLCAGIAVDGVGHAYITGTTASPDFPVANALQPRLQEGACTNGPCTDAFVAKINPAGSALIYATYLGGTSTELGSGIAVDAGGNAFMTGTTGSTNFPNRNAFQATKRGITDVFVTKVNPTGSALVYSTYLGGSLVQIGSGIAVDSAGSAYITGLTLSDDFPTINALQPAFGGGDCNTGTQTGPCPDAFVTKLNPSGSALVYSTYLGGNSAENIQAIGSSITPFYGIAVDAAGNAYVTGSTSSLNFPTTNAVQRGFGGGDCGQLPCPDAYVAKLNPAGNAFIYSTFLGGDGAETTSAVAVDSAGNAYVVGESRSTTFRKASVAPEIVTERIDAFVVRIADSSGTIPPTGSKVFRSFGFNAIGNFELDISVDPASLYSLDVSTDLRVWFPLVIFQEKDGKFRFVDFAAFDFFQRFYRLTPVPQQ